MPTFDDRRWVRQTMRTLALSMLAAMLSLTACTKTYGPSSLDSLPVTADASQAVVVAAFDMEVGGAGINYLTSDARTEYRLAFHRYDPVTQTLSDPPLAFYIEQECLGAKSGKACATLPNNHRVVSVPPGDYILAFIHSYTPGTFLPLGYGGVTVGAFSSVVNAVPIMQTNNVVGSIAAVPGASVAGNGAPRVHVGAGEVVYIGFLTLAGAVWTKAPSASDPGLAQLYITVASQPDAARGAVSGAGIDPTKMVERLAASEAN